MRAAASSIASGSPSSARHSVVGSSPGRAARRVNSSTASSSASGASSWTTSPSTSSGTWLVARIRSAGAASSRRTTSAAAASRTCSQLSRTRTAGAERSRSRSAGSPPLTPTDAITASTTSPALAAASSRTSHTVPLSSLPVAIATAVLPMPPGPTTSTRRWPATSSASCAISVVAADELGLHRRQVSRRRRAQRRVLLQDPELQLLQSGAGLEAELVGQRRADALVGRQRVALATGAVEGRDQQLPQWLAVGLGGDGRLDARRSPARRAAAAPRAASRAASRAPPRAGRGAAPPSRPRRAARRRESARAPRC